MLPAVFGAAVLLLGPSIGALYVTVWRIWGSAMDEASGAAQAPVETAAVAGASAAAACLRALGCRLDPATNVHRIATRRDRLHALAENRLRQYRRRWLAQSASAHHHHHRLGVVPLRGET